MTADKSTIDARIAKMKTLGWSSGLYQMCSLALSIVHDTLSANHPLRHELTTAMAGSHDHRRESAVRTLLDLHEVGALNNPRLVIAGEIEGGLLDIAQQQVQAAELESDVTRVAVHRAIAAFMAGAALEDALRRLSDANSVPYDPTHTAIAKLQGGLYQPSKSVEIVSLSETKQITAWGDTRNHADHGRFQEITQAAVVTMVIGVRAFIEKHLS